MLLAVQVRVLLLAEVPGGGMEERPQGDMQADPADAEEEDEEVITHIKNQFHPTTAVTEAAKGHMQEQIWRMHNTITDHCDIYNI